MNFFFQMVLSGVMLGGAYSLIGIGFVIIYKSTGVINFAQGQLLAIGALILWTFASPLGLPMWLAILLSIVCTAIMGVLIERLTIRPMTGQPLMSIIVMTIGLASLFDSVLPAIFGTLEMPYPTRLPGGGAQILGLSVSYEYLASFIIALALVSFFLYFFQRTRRGIFMRAVADGHDIARSCGIKVGSIFSWAWIIASVSALIGGFLLGSIMGVSPSMATIFMKIFPVVILGGLGSIPGCIIAGPVVGVIEMLGTGYGDILTEGGAGEVIPYIVILLTLMFRPYGIFGEKDIERI